MACSGYSQQILVKTNVIKAKKFDAYWFNPSTGLSDVISKGFQNNGRFEPPIKTDNKDWVLVINDVALKNRVLIK